MEFIYAQTSSESSFLSFLPFVLMILVIYFLMLRPQMKQQKERKKMLKNLQKGDKVITSGGIHGTVVGFKSKNNIILLDIDKNATIKISKSAISSDQSLIEKE